MYINISYLTKKWSLYICKFEFSSPRNALCQIWLKLAQWFWIFQRIFTLLLSRSYGGGLGPGFEQTEIPFTQVICFKFGCCPVVLEKKMQMWKVYNEMTTTDNG